MKPQMLSKKILHMKVVASAVTSTHFKVFRKWPHYKWLALTQHKIVILFCFSQNAGLQIFCANT